MKVLLAISWSSESWHNKLMRNVKKLLLNLRNLRPFVVESIYWKNKDQIKEKVCISPGTPGRLIDCIENNYLVLNQCTMWQGMRLIE
jgi:superfamily II DNA/RNA helicase